VKYEVFITYADYEAAQRANQPLFARKLPITMGVLTVIILGWLRLTGRPIDSVALLSVGIVWIAVFYGNAVSLPKTWRREFEQSDRKSYTIEVTEASLKLTSETESVSWPWSFFSGWREGERCFLLYYNKGWNHIIIPTHVLDSQEDLDSLRGVLKKYLGNPRR
jgi:hypothetical protein